MALLTRHEGRTYFEDHNEDVIARLANALDDFRTRMGKPDPTLLTLNCLNEAHRADIEEWIADQGLKLKLNFSNTVLAVHHTWFGRPKVQGAAGRSERSSVRVVESSRARVLASIGGVAPMVVETVITLPLAIVIETPISTALCHALAGPPQLPPPALRALCAVNPRDPEADERDDGQEEAAQQFAAMVLDLSAPRVINPEHIEAFRVAHSSSEKSRPALLALINGGSPQQWIERPITEDERIWKPLVMRQLQRSSRAWRICQMLGRQIEDALPVQEQVIYLPAPEPAPMLPQEVTMHPRDVKAELAMLAAQKATSTALSAPGRIPPNNSFSYEAHKARREQEKAAVQPARSSEELLEEAAMKRMEVSPQMLNDFMEAAQFAVEHPDNQDAQLFVDGHRLDVLDQKGLIILKHREKALGKLSLKVGVKLRQMDSYRFVARREEVRAYLETCRQVFEAKGITPLRAGEKYPWETKAA